MAQPILTQQQREQLQALVEQFPTQDAVAARTVVFLRAACVDLEIIHTGNKPELVARIWQVIQRANEMLALEEQQLPDDQQPPVTPPPLGGQLPPDDPLPLDELLPPAQLPAAQEDQLPMGDPVANPEEEVQEPVPPPPLPQQQNPFAAMQFMAQQQPPAQQQPFQQQPFPPPLFQQQPF
jgi:hypothetical protein